MLRFVPSELLDHSCWRGTPFLIWGGIPYTSSVCASEHLVGVSWLILFPCAFSLSLTPPSLSLSFSSSHVFLSSQLWLRRGQTLVGINRERKKFVRFPGSSCRQYLDSILTSHEIVPLIHFQTCVCWKLCTYICNCYLCVCVCVCVCVYPSSIV